MTWFAIYEIDAGRLRSVGSIVTSPLGAGLASKNLGDTRPSDDLMWDEATLTFVPRPAKILVDRFNDFMDHPDFSEIYNRLAGPKQNQIKKAIEEVLDFDTIRFRNIDRSIHKQGEPPIERKPPWVPQGI